MLFKEANRIAVGIAMLALAVTFLISLPFAHLRELFTFYNVISAQRTLYVWIRIALCSVPATMMYYYADDKSNENKYKFWQTVWIVFGVIFSLFGTLQNQDLWRGVTETSNYVMSGRVTFGETAHFGFTYVLHIIFYFVPVAFVGLIMGVGLLRKLRPLTPLPSRLPTPPPSQSPEIIALMRKKGKPKEKPKRINWDQV